MDYVKYKMNTKYKHRYINNAIDSGKLTCTEIGVYVTLIRFVNKETGYAYPSHEQLMRCTNIKKIDTLIKHVTSLESKGFIMRDKGNRGKNTRYYFIHPTTIDGKNQVEDETLHEDSDDLDENEMYDYGIYD